MIYFAAHAPACPSWFELADPAPEPSRLTAVQAMSNDEAFGALPGDGQREIEIYFQNPDAFTHMDPETLRVRDGIKALIEASAVAREAVRAQNEAKRYYTWRWSYATNMSGTAKQFLPTESK